MPSQNQYGSRFLYWRVRHGIRPTLTSVLLPRLVLSAAFLSPLANQRI